MFRVEIYKVTHSLSHLFMLIVIVSVAAILGVSATQMGLSDIENLISVTLVSSSAVLMLYIAIIAIMFINRDYASNNYRVLVGTGICRGKILFSKYVVFLCLGLIAVVARLMAACAIPVFMNKVPLAGVKFVSILLYMLVYTSIISTVFLLSIIGRTFLKSILINIVYIILSGISVTLLSGNTEFAFVIPVQSLQLIANHQNNMFVAVTAISLLYSGVSYAIAHLIFSRQEL